MARRAAYLPSGADGSWLRLMMLWKRCRKIDVGLLAFAIGAEVAGMQVNNTVNGKFEACVCACVAEKD